MSGASFRLVETARQHRTYQTYHQGTATEPCISCPVIFCLFWQQISTESNTQNVECWAPYCRAQLATGMPHLHRASLVMPELAFHDFVPLVPLLHFDRSTQAQLRVVIFILAGPVFFFLYIAFMSESWHGRG